MDATLDAEVDRQARAAALARLLADLDARLGPVPPSAAAEAAAAFDDLEPSSP